MPAGRILVGVLKQAAGEPDLVRGFDGKRGCRGAAKVVHAHWGAEVLARVPADDQIEGPVGELSAVLRDPERVVGHGP